MVLSLLLGPASTSVRFDTNQALEGLCAACGADQGELRKRGFDLSSAAATGAFAVEP